MGGGRNQRGPVCPTMDVLRISQNRAYWERVWVALFCRFSSISINFCEDGNRVVWAYSRCGLTNVAYSRLNRGPSRCAKLPAMELALFTYFEMCSSNFSSTRVPFSLMLVRDIYMF